MNTYGTLDYSHGSGTWELVDREGQRISIKEGDCISLGYLQGREVIAVLQKDMMGHWVWAVTPVDATPRPGGTATIRRAG